MTDAMGAVAVAAADSVMRLFPVNGVNFGTDVSGKPLPAKYPYNVYSASLGRGDTYTLDAIEGLRWGRIVLQSFGKVAASALADAESLRAALVGTSLAITGYSTTPCRAELDPAVTRDPDDSGVVGVTTTYTFTATKET